VDTEEGRDLWRYELRRLHYVIISHLAPLLILKDKTKECLELLAKINPQLLRNNQSGPFPEMLRYVFFHATFLKEWQDGGSIYYDYCRLKRNETKDSKIQTEMKELLSQIGKSSLATSTLPSLPYIDDDPDQTSSIFPSVAYAEMSADLTRLLFETSLLTTSHKQSTSAFTSTSLPTTMTENHRLQHLHALGLELLD